MQILICLFLCFSMFNLAEAQVAKKKEFLLLDVKNRSDDMSTTFFIKFKEIPGLKESGFKAVPSGTNQKLEFKLSSTTIDKKAITTFNFKNDPYIQKVNFSQKNRDVIVSIIFNKDCTFKTKSSKKDNILEITFTQKGNEGNAGNKEDPFTLDVTNKNNTQPKKQVEELPQEEVKSEEPVKQDSSEEVQIASSEGSSGWKITSLVTAGTGAAALGFAFFAKSKSTSAWNKFADAKTANNAADQTKWENEYIKWSDYYNYSLIGGGTLLVIGVTLYFTYPMFTGDTAMTDTISNFSFTLNEESSPVLLFNYNF